MTAGPDFTGLGFVGGAAEQEVDPQSISKFDTGEGQIRQHGDGSIEEDFRGGPVKTDSNVTD